MPKLKKALCLKKMKRVNGLSIWMHRAAKLYGNATFALRLKSPKPKPDQTWNL